MKGIPVRLNGDPVRSTFVIADTYQQFRNWCRYSKVNHRSRMIRFVESVSVLYGVSDCDFVFTGLGLSSPGVPLRQTIHAIKTCSPDYRGEAFYQYEPDDIEPNVVCAAE